MLEKTLERHREELKREKEEHRTEKARRLKTQRTCTESIETVKQVDLRSQISIKFYLLCFYAMHTYPFCFVYIYIYITSCLMEKAVTMGFNLMPF